jgi:hypothetical protein
MKKLIFFLSLLAISFSGFSQDTTVTNQVFLDGRASSSDNGKIVKYQWTQIAGPTTDAMGTPNSDTTWVTFKDAGLYTFQLKVTDNNGYTGLSNAEVTAGLYGEVKAVITVTKFNILIPPSK